MNHQKPAYTIRETEKLLNLSHASIYREINSHRLRTFTVGKRRFVSAAEVDRWVAARVDEAEAA